MARVDFEAAWQDLAAAVSERQGIGRNALFALMKRLELEHRIDEGLAERAFRLYGVQLSEDLRAAARDAEKQDGYAATGAEGQDPLLATSAIPGDRRTTIDGGMNHGYGHAGSAAEARVLA